MNNRITFYQTKTHPVYGGIRVDHDKPFVKVDPRELMKVKHSKDVHKLVADCEAEKESNAISVRHLFERKLSRKERKKLHRN